jgi:hypothetical protein
MSRILHRWLRVVVPTEYLLLAILFGLIFRYPGIALACILYAAYRARAFHPFYQGSYNAYLRASPWECGKALPFGPLSLVVQDAFVVSLLILLPVLFGRPPFLIGAAIFIVVFSAHHAFAFWWIGHRFHAYAVCVVLPLFFLSGTVPFAPYAASLLLLLIVWRGIRLSLASFTWDSMSSERMRAMAKQRMVGWPFEVLPPERPKSTVNLGSGDKVALSFLVGWLYFVMSASEALGNPRGLSGVAPMAIMFCLLLSLVTALLYIAYCRPPISIAGRIATRRLIIPAYDKILVAPVLIAVLALSGPTFLPLYGSGSQAVVIHPLLCSLSLLLAFFGEPPMDEWLLTGNHRLVFPQRTGGPYVQL